MNYSRYVYFEALCTQILTLNRRQLHAKRSIFLNEIDSQIEQIYALQKDGSWEITKGDYVCIGFMEKLKKSILKPLAKFEIKNLLQKSKQNAEKKLKVVFLAQETTLWTSFESVYYSMEQDDRYIVRLVYIPFTHVNMDKTVNHYRIYKEQMGLPILKHDEYSISEDSPDIVIFAKPYDCIPMQFYITEVNKVVRRSVYIPYGIQTATGEEYARYACGLPLHDLAWKIIADSPVFVKEAVKFGHRGGQNMLCTGSPRVDLIRRPVALPKIPAEWLQKIGKRKTILYNTHFSVLPNEGFGTFMNYAKKLFDYFYNQAELVLLWRPHPLLENALFNSGLMTRNEVDQVFSYAQSCPNIILDTSWNYTISFFASDAMISDGTSFLKEYLFTDKPILYTRKPNTNCDINDPDLLDIYYIADDFPDILNFCNMVSSGVDDKKELRLKKVRDSFFGVNSSVADEIKDSFYRVIVEEERNNADVIKNCCNE